MSLTPTKLSLRYSTKPGKYSVRTTAGAELPLSTLEKITGFVRKNSENVMFDTKQNAINFIKNELADLTAKNINSKDNEALKLKSRRPKLFNKIISLAETKKLSPKEIRTHPDVLKLNNNKEIGYGSLQKIITDEKGDKFFKEVAKNKSYFVGDIRKDAEAQIDNILEDYYKGEGTKKLTKKYFPDSVDGKANKSSSVLEAVIRENVDPKKLKKRPSAKGSNQQGSREEQLKVLTNFQKYLSKNVNKFTSRAQGEENLKDLLKKSDSETVGKFVNRVNSLRKLYNSKELPKGFKINDKVKNSIKYLPARDFVETELRALGFSERTIKSMNDVENAVQKLTKASTMFEHSLPRTLIRQLNLPKKYYLAGERTSNFLNKFKMQFDSQIANAAKAYAESDQTPADYKKYKDKIKNIRNKVKKYTGGYEIGYVDFDKNGKAIPVTNQSSFLKGEGELGARTTGIKNFFKNTQYHNNLYKNYKKNPNNPDFNTLKFEISESNLDFKPEFEIEQEYNKIKNFKNIKQFQNYFNKAPDSSFFKSLFRGKGGKLGVGLTTALAALSLPAVLSASETNQPQVSQPQVIEKPETIQYNRETGSFLNTATEDKTDQNQLLQWGQENPLTAVAGTSVALSAQEIPRAYKMRRGVGDTGPLPGGKGRIRSSIGIGGALKPVLTTLGTPLVGLGFEGLMAKERLENDETMSDILMDPLGPAATLAFMEPLSRSSGVVRGAPTGIANYFKNYGDLSNVGQARPGLTSKALRLGLSPRMIAGASRFLGLPGLALTTGLAGYNAYKNYQNEEGMIYNFFNNDE